MANYECLLVIYQAPEVARPTAASTVARVFTETTSGNMALK